MKEKLVAVFKVTEWRDGAIYKTKFIEERWIPVNCELYKPGAFGEMFVNLSTDRMRELNYKLNRTTVESK